MNHPNIAKVLDAGTTSTGRPFFVMELLAGRPLHAFCDAERLSIPDRLRLFQQVCDALQHAHQKGIIHRDLKPGNILVESVNGVAVPKVIDFGLAKTVGEQLGETSLHTLVGVIFGTPAYVSPEQTQLGAQDVDTRADVYSLGVLLYELLTGTTPVPRDDLARMSLDAAFAAVARTESPPPSFRLKRLGDRLPELASRRFTTPEQLVAAVRGDLDWISLKAIEKDRRRRYQSASELGSDIARHLADEPVGARPPSASYQLRKFVRRHRLGVGLTAGVMLASVAGAAVSLTLMLRARQSEAELAAFATFLTDDVLAAARPKGLPGGLGTDATIGDALVAAQSAIPQRFAGQVRGEALTRHAMGVTFDAIGEPNRAIAELERAWELRRRSLGESHPRTLSTMSSLGQAYFSAGRLEDSISLLSTALQRQEATLGPGHADAVTTMIMLGKAYSRADDTPQLARAIAVGEEALVRATRTFGPDSQKRFACMVTLGGAYFLAGRFAEAAALHEQALHNFRSTFSPAHPYTLSVMSDLALDYMGARQLERSIELQREVAARHQEQLGSEHPTLLASLSSLAYVQLLQGDFKSAETTAGACLMTRRRLLGEKHPDTITIKVTLSQSLLGQQQYAAAEELVRDVVAERAVTSPHHWRFHFSRLLLGEIHLGVDRPESSVVLESSFEALKDSRSTIPIWSGGIRSSLERIASLQGDRQRRDDAVRWSARNREWAEWENRRREEIASPSGEPPPNGRTHE